MRRSATDPWLSMNCMMSCLVMRPPSPVPEICERLTPCSRAILRTSGEERASSSSFLSAGAGAGSGRRGRERLLLFSFFFALAAQRLGAGFAARRRLRGFAIGGDSADDRIHADGRAFGDFDFLQNAGGRSGNFGVDFVGGDFEERLVALDFVAGLLQPLGDGAFDDGFAHLGHDDVSWHDFLPCSPQSREEGWAQTNIIAGRGGAQRVDIKVLTADSRRIRGEAAALG